MIKNSGYCPYCEMISLKIPLKLNFESYFECPKCHVQLFADSNFRAVVLRNTGNGNFSDSDYLNATDFIKNYILTRQKKYCLYPVSDNKTFSNKKELEKYITKEVL
jgi:hypothetical protein